LTEKDVSTVETNRFPDLTFDQLPESLKAGAARVGWTTLMPVQSKALPRLLAGRDIMIQARTGSGKTGAFLLPMLERLRPDDPYCQALVLVPTRELAKQVWEQAELICAGTGICSVAVYGGVGYGTQIDALKNGAQLVVGTPGRVLDHLIRGTFTLDKLQMRVFDEADRMLSMGFYPDMQEVQRHLPDRTLDTLQNSMFSATFPSFVLRTSKEFLRDPEFLSVSGDQIHVTETTHVSYLVPAMDKDRSLVRIIEIENPASVIIFCNTKAVVHYVTVVLQRFGYDADELSADRSQTDRERILKQVCEGKLRFLVATDVAARGLDIKNLSHVIQYEPPGDPEGYIHRAGRTGRAGAAGVAIALVSEAEAMTLDGIAKRYKINLQSRPVPTDEDVESVVAERVTTLLEARLRERDSLKAERSQRFVRMANNLAENETALIAMLIDDYYQETLHAPVIKPRQGSDSFASDRGGSHSSFKGKRRRVSSSDTSRRRHR
jgi:ATP-dependent RNA helicase DeaD